ncbi:MAG: glycoside hydrolase family 28 protein [Anaerolineales bacterium]|nr:glycoside hydrolase family 28 protein [Anaerolineales bacterium]
MKASVILPGQGNPVTARLFGARGDGKTRDTAALQAAIDACASQGGGTVVIPAGQYLTGSLFLHDDISLYLDAGATLLGSQDPADYPVTSSRWEGTEQPTYAPLIGGGRLRNIAILGRGTIDGRGDFWWTACREKRLSYPRPRLIGFHDCTNLLIEGVTLINSPSWTLNPVRCQNVTVHAVTIINPPDSPNTDGINPDSCRFVRISDCYVSVGDDCITIKSGTQHEKPEYHAPCRDIAITNCTLERGHGGVVIGSEMSGDVQNVVISNCIFVGTDRGIRFKSRRGRGGVVEDVRISNLIMENVLCPLTMNLYYGCGAWGDPEVSDKKHHPIDDGTPRFRRIHLSHITARNVRLAAGFVYGLAEMPVEDLTLSDVSISITSEAEAGYPEMADDIPEMQQAGFFVRNAHRLRLERVEISNQRGPAFDIGEASQIEISTCGTPTPAAGQPVIRLQNVASAFVRACRQESEDHIFLQIEGSRTRDLVLAGNALTSAAVQSGADVPPDALQIISGEIL